MLNGFFNQLMVLRNFKHRHSLKGVIVLGNVIFQVVFPIVFVCDPTKIETIVVLVTPLVCNAGVYSVSRAVSVFKQNSPVHVDDEVDKLCA